MAGATLGTVSCRARLLPGHRTDDGSPRPHHSGCRLKQCTRLGSSCHAIQDAYACCWVTWNSMPGGQGWQLGLAQVPGPGYR